MKRCGVMVAAVAAALCMVLSLTGCTSGDSYTPETKDPVVSSPVIGEDGVLRVGVDISNAPLAGQAESGIVGFDVDLAAALADEMGLKLEIVDVGSDPAKALEAGTVDIVMGIDQSTSNDKLWLSSSYLPTGVALFAMSADTPLPVASAPSEADDAAAEDGAGSDDAAAEGDSSAEASAGVSIAAQVSSMSSWAVTNEFGNEALVSEADLPLAFQRLADGEVTYVASDAVIGSYLAAEKGIDAVIIGLMQEPSGYCIAVLADNAELQQAVDSALKKVDGGGVVDVIVTKWLGSVVDLSNVELTAGAKAAAAADAEESASAGEDAEESAN